MKIILLNGTSIPLYEQIKNAVKDNIVRGELTDDQQLPSVRELSRQLKVSILTVKKAYDELEKEGFIVIRQGLGTFVADNNSQLRQEEEQKEMEAYLSKSCQLAKRLALSKEDFFALIDYIYQGDDSDE